MVRCFVNLVFNYFRIVSIVMWNCFYNAYFFLFIFMTERDAEKLIDQ